MGAPDLQPQQIFLAPAPMHLGSGDQYNTFHFHEDRAAGVTALLMAAAGATDVRGRRRWKALQALVRRPAPPGTSQVGQAESELRALQDDPSNPVRARELYEVLAARARTDPAFGRALAEAWPGGVGLVLDNAAAQPLPDYLTDPGTWPRAADWDGLVAGVHPARPQGSRAGALPPYVPRDADDRLREALAVASREGGFVLVTGDSAAGKTRAAFEALRQTLPDHRVLVPASPDDLHDVTRAVRRSEARCALWLDDLERYLAPGGLSLTVLDALKRMHTPVLATMRLQQFDRFGHRVDPGPDREMARPTVGVEVLRAAVQVEFARVWSASELRRAEECHDRRIIDAVAHHGPYGIAEYLAAGPALLDTWRRGFGVGANPRGAALVAAAVDLARTGMKAPYVRALLESLHGHYLKEAGGKRLRPEPLDEAFAWATQPRLGVTGLLVPSEDEDGWEVIDYLVDRTDSPIPLKVWDTVLRYALDADRFAIGFAAVAEGRLDVAEAAWRPLADAGSVESCHLMGRLADATERETVAERYLRAAVNGGSLEAAADIGLLLGRTEREKEAEAYLRLAADGGLVRALLLLGRLLAQTDRVEEAEECLRRAAEAGNVTAVAELGLLLLDEGRMTEAEEHLRRASQAGNSGARAGLALLMLRTGRASEVHGLTAGRSMKSLALQRLIVGMGILGLRDFAISDNDGEAETRHSANAERRFAQAAVLTHVESTDDPWSRLLVRRPGQDAYEHWRASRGDGYAALALNGLIREDDNQHRENQLRAAAGSGDPEAMAEMGGLLADSRRAEEARVLLRRAADAGNATALHRLIIEAGRSGNNAGVVDLARPAADAGDTRAAQFLGLALSTLGREEEAVPYLRTAVEAGHEEAASTLALALAVAGLEKESRAYDDRLDDSDIGPIHATALMLRQLASEEKSGLIPDLIKKTYGGNFERRAEAYLRFAARAGHTESAATLAAWLEKANRFEEAESYRRQAAENGDVASAAILGLFLEVKGEWEEAERAYRRAADRGHIYAAKRLARLLTRTGRRAEARAYRRRARNARRLFRRFGP